MGIIRKSKRKRTTEKRNESVCQVKRLAQIESLWVFREGLMSFINIISYIRQSNLLLHFFRTVKR